MKASPVRHRRGILIVDDEPMIRSYLSAMLRLHGFEVWTAADGNEALHIYHVDGPAIDLVLLDMLMGPADGLDTLRLLKRFDPSVRVAFMTGRWDCYQREQLLALGVAGVLYKPFKWHEMLQFLLDCFRPTAAAV